MSADPLVSIIIPVGPYHVDHCRVAAASVQQQSLAHLCETIVVADGDAEIPDMPGVLVLPSEGRRTGPAHTRNRGIDRARGAFLIFLDADDYLLPRTVEHFLRAYATGRMGYVYGNAYTLEPWHTVNSYRGQASATIDEERELIYMLRAAPDYKQQAQKHYNLHVVTALVPAKHVRAVGGFDERVDAWEDWTLWLRLAIAGICGEKIPQPVFTYRVYEGDRMQHFFKDTSTMEPIWALYRNAEGDIPMASCCGGDNALAKIAADAVKNAPEPTALAVGDGKIRVEYIGPSRGSFSYDMPGLLITLGNNATHRYADVTPEQYQWLKGMLEDDIRVVSEFDKPGPPPEPLPILTAANVLTPDANANVIRPRSKS